MTDYAVDRASAYIHRSRGAHAAFSLYYHLVWGVRARRPVLVGAVATALHECLLRVGEGHGINLLAFHIEPDHVHLLLSLRPTLAVAEAVKRLKGASSRQLARPSRSCWRCQGTPVEHRLVRAQPR
jgi:REP element-mobilizing transposase RayT